MKKNIIPHRIIIEFQPDGTYKDSIIMYRTEDSSGAIGEKFHTLSVKLQSVVPQMNAFMRKAINFTKKQEGITITKAEAAQLTKVAQPIERSL